MFIPVFESLAKFYKNGLILATIFSTDLCGLSTIGSILKPIHTKS
jgi:hypothetical protein